jgi:hypothetical protein
LSFSENGCNIWSSDQNIVAMFSTKVFIPCLLFSVMNSYKYLLLLVLALVLLAPGCTSVSRTGLAIGYLCALFVSVLPIIIILMIVLAAAVYAVGQIMGAETRARATVWATNMIIGAIISAIIFILGPYILNLLMPDLSIESIRNGCVSLAASGDLSGNKCGTCPSGYACAPLFSIDGKTISGYQCMPATP